MSKELQLIFDEVIDIVYGDMSFDVIDERVKKQIPDEEVRNKEINMLLSVADMYKHIKEGSYDIGVEDDDIDDLLILFFKNDNSIAVGDDFYRMGSTYKIGSFSNEYDSLVYNDVSNRMKKVILGYNIKTMEKFWDLYKSNVSACDFTNKQNKEIANLIHDLEESLDVMKYGCYELDLSFDSLQDALKDLYNAEVECRFGDDEFLHTSPLCYLTSKK